MDRIVKSQAKSQAEMVLWSINKFIDKELFLLQIWLEKAI
jgi:hypothetical protein